ncbi:hypothetical protein SNE510_75160 [Streptomyces sp. NE5-10]|nr:hypothetical protein SNE510_75160 [Streptomyces sp. NE5-10]
MRLGSARIRVRGGRAAWAEAGGRFSGLFRRATGVAPSEYRPRFGVLARVGRPEEELPTGQRARIRSTPSR